MIHLHQQRVLQQKQVLASSAPPAVIIGEPSIGGEKGGMNALNHEHPNDSIVAIQSVESYDYF